MKCRICGAPLGGPVFLAKEMMFGLKETFSYLKCGTCGVLQICDIPTDISKFYPSEYYSLALNTYEPGSLKRFGRQMRDRYAVSGKGFFGRMLFSRFPNPELRAFAAVPLRREMAILDMGCGKGTLLRALHNIGFRNLTGIDPYVEHEIHLSGLQILRKSIHEVEGNWDIIRLHHTLEHLDGQSEALRAVAKNLKSDGLCIISIPLVSGDAWEVYGTNWVQLDAPRHFFLHTPESMNLLVEQARMTIRQTIYDSTGFQFWGSEQYKRGVPLMAETSYLRNPSASFFSRLDIERFDARAVELNRQNRGDQATFFLVKKTPAHPR